MSKIYWMFFKLILRWRRFWHHARNVEVEEQRSEMENFVKLFAMPDDIECTPVDLGDILGEWNQVRGQVPCANILYLHGGGYCLGSINSHRELSARISRAAQSRSLVIAYRLAPENPFPAAVEDALSAYRWMLKQGIPSSQIVIAGDSAGGGLTLAILAALRDAGDPLPCAAVCISPWTDMLATGASIVANDKIDPMINGKVIAWFAKYYLGNEGDPKNPLASPLYADFQEFPPLLIQVGSDETLLDDSRRVAEKAKQAGVEVELQIWPQMTHVWHFFGHFLPEAGQAIQQIGEFIQAKVNRVE